MDWIGWDWIGWDWMDWIDGIDGIRLDWIGWHWIDGIGPTALRHLIQLADTEKIPYCFSNLLGAVLFIHQIDRSALLRSAKTI